MWYWELLLGVSAVTTWSACTDTCTHTRVLIIYEQGHRDARARPRMRAKSIKRRRRGWKRDALSAWRWDHREKARGGRLEYWDMAVGMWNRDTLITDKQRENDRMTAHFSRLPLGECSCALPEIWLIAKQSLKSLITLKQEDSAQKRQKL